jgi:hypothetical protein
MLPGGQISLYLGGVRNKKWGSPRKKSWYLWFEQKATRLLSTGKPHLWSWNSRCSQQASPNHGDACQPNACLRNHPEFLSG